MRHTILTPVGVAVSDLQVVAMDAATVAELTYLLAVHGVAVMANQAIDDRAFATFLQQFGNLTFSKGEEPLPGFPDLNVITNLNRSTPPRSVFHVDTSYVRQPPAYTALRAVQIPEHGGQTLFTNQYRAFDTLSSKLRAHLAGRVMTHVVTGVNPGPDEETCAKHPVFGRHPISGRTALYLSTPERCVAISGMTDTAAADMIQLLYAHSTTAANTFRHTWSERDLVMWDNRCVMHRADHANVGGHRVMHRGMVAGRSLLPVGSAR